MFDSFPYRLADCIMAEFMNKERDQDACAGITRRKKPNTQQVYTKGVVNLYPHNQISEKEGRMDIPSFLSSNAAFPAEVPMICPDETISFSFI